jgi:hypothetical protein
MEVREIDESIKIGDGDSKIGNLACEVTQINRMKVTVTLNDFKYVPNLFVILLNLNSALKKDFKVRNDSIIVSLNYKHARLTV